MKKLLFLLLLVPAICQAQIPVDKQYHIGAGLSYIILKYVDKHKKPEKVDDSLYSILDNSISGSEKDGLQG